MIKFTPYVDIFSRFPPPLFGLQRPKGLLWDSPDCSLRTEAALEDQALLDDYHRPRSIIETVLSFEPWGPR